MKKTKRKIYSPLKFRQIKRKKHKLMPIFRLNIFAVILVFAFLVGNLVMLNTITTNGYKIKKIENQILELKDTNQQLSLDLSDKQSIENVLAKLGHLDMVESKNVSFITMQSVAVARK